MGPPITTPGGTGDRDDSDKPEQWPEFALTRINITSGCHNRKTLSETYKDNTIIPSIGPSYKTHRETARLTERVMYGSRAEEENLRKPGALHRASCQPNFNSHVIM